MQSVIVIMICDGNCFECKFPDCILDFEDGSLIDLEIETSLQIDDILFKKDAISIEVSDYRQYPFIPSEEIPYNPKWKSQVKWREYYRSRARGNRKEKQRAYSCSYACNHKEKHNESNKNIMKKIVIKFPIIKKSIIKSIKKDIVNYGNYVIKRIVIKNLNVVGNIIFVIKRVSQLVIKSMCFSMIFDFLWRI